MARLRVLQMLKSFIGWGFQINHSPKTPKFSPTFPVCNELVCNVLYQISLKWIIHLWWQIFLKGKITHVLLGLSLLSLTGINATRSCSCSDENKKIDIWHVQWQDKRNFKKIRSIILTPFSTVLKEVLATKMADITVSIKDIICLKLLNNTSAHASRFWYISLLSLQK